MAKAGKVILIGCGSVVLLGLLAVAGIVLYLRAHGDELLEQGQAVREQGREAGTRLAGSACVDAALVRLGTDAGFGGQIEARLWLDGCLEGSDPGAALCRAVPPESEIMKSVS